VNARMVLGAVALIVLVSFIVSNTEEAPVNFLFWEWTLPLWLALTVAALLGAAIGSALMARRARRR
jgi:uncharacterized integral membrane protein